VYVVVVVVGSLDNDEKRERENEADRLRKRIVRTVRFSFNPTNSL